MPRGPDFDSISGPGIFHEDTIEYFLEDILHDIVTPEILALRVGHIRVDIKRRKREAIDKFDCDVIFIKL